MPPQAPQAAPAAPIQREHDNDIFIVTNIDIDCNESTVYTVERSLAVAPIPGENNPLNIPRFQSQQEESSFDHSHFFMVRYNGEEFKLAPGQEYEWPRYIAMHYAKHLADHMLQKMEDAFEREAKAKNLTSWRRGLVSSNVERPKMLDRIVKLKSWFLQPTYGMPQPQQLDNQPAQDLGHVPNYALGPLKAEPKTAEQILAEGNMPPVAPVGPPAPPLDNNTAPHTPAGADPFPAETPTTAASAPPLAANGLPLGPGSLDTPTAPIDGMPTKPETTQPPADQPPAGPVERTKSDLIREAVMLGIEVTGRESADELKSKISAF